MSVLDQLQDLKNLYSELRLHIYSDTLDEPYLPDGEFISRNPAIPERLFSEIADLLLAINEDLNSSLLDEISSYFSSESTIGEYVYFDEEDFQLEHIQNDIEAYDEGLSAAQETAASLSHERKTELWDGAYEDVKYLFEELFAKLF
jgi:hypothetical protein